MFNVNFSESFYVILLHIILKQCLSLHQFKFWLKNKRGHKGGRENFKAMKCLFSLSSYNEPCSFTL